MSTELGFLPDQYQPRHPSVPTMAEIQSATLILDGAFIDVTLALQQAHEQMEELRGTVRRNYETSFSITREYPVTGRDFRQMQTRLARALRRPALIHNGRKPR